MRHRAAVKVGFVALVTCLVAASVAIKASSRVTTIRVIYTNDTLGYFEPCG